MTDLHLRGVVLPDDEVRDLWVRDATIHTEPVPGAETVVDGGYLIPGLVDAHCHIGIGQQGPVDLDEAARQAELERDKGTLLLRDCGVPLDTRPLQERADLPRIVRSGRHIARPKRYLRQLGVELDDPALLPQAVAEQARYGDGWVKLVGDWIDRSAGERADLAPLWPDDVLAEAIAVAHRAGARVTAHVFSGDALPGLLDAGIDCIEHGTGLSDSDVERMAAAGTALVPTLINVENFPDIARQAARYPVYAAHMRKLHSGARRTVAAAIEAGVPVYAGTDAGGGVAHGRAVDEIQALRGAGMSATDALAAGSWSARDWLGLPALSEGAPADVLAFDTDPRKDMGVLSTPSALILRGRVYGSAR